jgi:hypothetical protein
MPRERIKFWRGGKRVYGGEPSAKQGRSLNLSAVKPVVAAVHLVTISANDHPRRKENDGVAGDGSGEDNA